MWREARVEKEARITHDQSLKSILLCAHLALSPRLTEKRKGKVGATAFPAKVPQNYSSYFTLQKTVKDLVEIGN